MDETFHRAYGPDGEPVVIDALPFDALCLGRGLFETVLLIGGGLVLEREHLARLMASCGALSICDPSAVKPVWEAAARRACASGLERARLRVAVFADEGRGPVGSGVREASAGAGGAGNA